MVEKAEKDEQMREVKEVGERIEVEEGRGGVVEEWRRSGGDERGIEWKKQEGKE